MKWCGKEDSDLYEDKYGQTRYKIDERVGLKPPYEIWNYKLNHNGDDGDLLSYFYQLSNMILQKKSQKCLEKQTICSIIYM